MSIVLGPFRCVLVLILGVAYPLTGLSAERFAYSANAHDYSISVYSVDKESGALRHLSHTPVPKLPSDAVMHPSGRFVYVVSKTPDTIAAYATNPVTGALKKVPGSPFPSKARSPYTLAFHPSGNFAYVAARFAGVGAYRVDRQTGALTPIPGSPFKAQERTRSVSVHPSGQFVYAVNGYSNSVSAYAVDSQTGVLKQLAGSPFSVGDMGPINYKEQLMEGVPLGAGGIPYHIALDPKGQFAFVVNWAAANVTVFRINAENGQLAPVDGSPFFTGFNPYSVSVHPSGEFIYVAQWSANEIMVHAVDAQTGRLTPTVGAPFSSGGEGPVAVKFSADGHRAYVPHFESNDVALHDVDKKTGTLQLKEIVKTRDAPWAFTLYEGEENTTPPRERVIAVEDGGVSLLALEQDKLVQKGRIASKAQKVAMANLPGGRFAYLLDQVAGSVATFSIEVTSGEITPVSDAVVKTGGNPVDLTVDANGWYLYVTNSADNTLSIYYLDPQTGRPKAVKGSPIQTGRGPTSVTLDRAARFAYVLNADANNVSVFRHFSGTAPLLLESRKYGSPFATGEKPAALTVEPTGRFVYVANAGSNNVSAYLINHQTGGLSDLPGSPFVAGQRPASIVSHPNGQWLFVANELSSDVIVYRIETELGALNRIYKTETLPVTILPFKPRMLRMNAAGNSLYVLSAGGRRLQRYSVDAALGRLQLVSEKTFVKTVSDVQLIDE